MDLLVPLLVPLLVVLAVALRVGRRRSRRVDDVRMLPLVQADADRTRAGFSCAQLPTERRRPSSVRGRG